MPARLPFLRHPRRPVSSRAVALWAARHYHAGLDSLTDLSGHGLHARLGSAVGADSNDPLRLQYAGEKYAYFSGVAGNYASAPDSAALSITGDIEWRFRATAPDWSPSAAFNWMTKWGGGGAGTGVSWRISQNTGGTLNLVTSIDGSNNTVNATSTAAVPFSDNAGGWIRITMDVDNGAGGNTVTFYTSEDGVTWSQLGDPVITAGTTSIYDSNALVMLNARDTGSAGNGQCGIYRAQIYDGIAGTKVFDFDASLLAEPYASVTDAHGNVITLNRSSTGRKLAVVDRDLFLLGTDDYFEVADHPLLNIGAGGAFTAVALARTYGTPATDETIFAKKANLTTAAGYAIYRNNSNEVVARTGDGTNQTARPASVITSGVVSLFAAIRAGGSLYAAIDGTISNAAADATGSLSSSDALRAGRLSGAGTGYGHNEVFALGFFRERLSTADLVRLKQELLAL